MWPAADDVEFESGTLHLRRARGGATATHPLLGDELRALRALKREAKSPFIFVLSVARHSLLPACRSWSTCGDEAKLPFKVHPHMLRHATGFALANKGTDTRTLQAYLGHRSIQSTVRTPSWRQGALKPVAIIGGTYSDKHFGKQSLCQRPACAKQCSVKIGMAIRCKSLQRFGKWGRGPENNVCRVAPFLFLQYIARMLWSYILVAAGLQMRPPPSFFHASQSWPSSPLVDMAGRMS